MQIFNLVVLQSHVYKCKSKTFAGHIKRVIIKNIIHKKHKYSNTMDYRKKCNG